MLCSPAAIAESGIRRVPCGYQQFAVNTAQKLTVPAACGSNPSLVRYLDNGATPTATVGMPIAVTDAPIPYQGSISALQFIAQTPGGIVNVLLYK